MADSRKRRAGEPSSVAVVRAVENRLRLHAKRGDAITVGLSGGIDSIVLLDALRRLAPAWDLRLSALHVHHGLSLNAAAWEDFCHRHCARRRVPFQAVRVQVAGAGANLEEHARLARYRAFEAHGGAIMALAHNRDDQAETVLMRLLRGAGVHGLAGMPDARIMGDAAHGACVGKQRLIRPLLAVSRDAIRDYAATRRLRWVEDESNDDPRFARNFLRSEVLPALERRFPGCRSALARAADRLREADGLLQTLAHDDLQAVTVSGQLDAARLAVLGIERAANALRSALASNGEPPMPAGATQEVLRQLLGAAVDSNPEVVLTRVTLSRYRGRIAIRPHGSMGVMKGWHPVPWAGEAEQQLPDGSLVRAQSVVGAGVSCVRLSRGTITLRQRRGGERIRLRPESPTRTLKNLLQEHAVPPWERDAMPLLYCNEQLVWIPTVGVASAFQAQPGESAWEFTWQLG